MAIWHNVGPVPQAAPPRDTIVTRDKIAPVIHHYPDDNTVCVYDISPEGKLYYNKKIRPTGWIEIPTGTITLKGRVFLSPDGMRMYARGVIGTNNAPVLCKFMRYRRPITTTTDPNDFEIGWTFHSWIAAPPITDIAVSFDHQITDQIKKDFIVLLSEGRIIKRPIVTTAAVTQGTWITMNVLHHNIPLPYTLKNIQAFNVATRPNQGYKAPYVYCLAEKQTSTGMTAFFATFEIMSVEGETIENMLDVQFRLSDDLAARMQHRATVDISKIAAIPVSAQDQITVYAVEDNIIYFSRTHYYPLRRTEPIFEELVPGNTGGMTIAGMPAIVQYNSNVPEGNNIPLNRIFYTGADARLMHIAHATGIEDYGPWLTRISAVPLNGSTPPQLDTQPNATVAQNGKVYLSVQARNGDVHICELTPQEMEEMNRV